MIDTSLARRFLIQRDRAPIRLLSRPLLENVTIIDSRFRSSLLCLLFFSSCVCVCVRAFYISLGRSLGGPIYRGPFARPRAYSIRSQQRECIVVSSSFRLVVVLVLLSRSGHSRDSRIGCRVFFFFYFLSFIGQSSLIFAIERVWRVFLERSSNSNFPPIVRVLRIVVQ
mgnify:CR=1 FL=1